MQMANATPQGIAGLMQKPPGQPPAPSPNKASPMAGLGSVDDRVSAYMGNTKPLEQRYAMSQDLLDLLALQKIKSQKDAAARQMQMQMAQQQAQNGEASMTVAQQREKEVTDMTKNELAQQRGDTAEQQASKQQEMMQKMMGGVASAPGAAMAAQPQAMAAGGIVGYAEGGAVGFSAGGDVDAARERRKAAQQKLYTYGLRQRQKDPTGFQAAQAELQAAQDALQAAEKIYAAEMAAAGANKLISKDAPIGTAARIEQAQAPARAPAAVSEAQATAAAGPQAAVPPRAPVVPAAPPPAAPPVPRPPAPAPAAAPAGLLTLPGAPPAVTLGEVKPQGDFGTKLQAAALKSAQIDAGAEQLKEEKRITDKMALSPEQRNVYNEGIAGLQQMYGEQYDPERQRQEGLKRFLIGAGGRRYGELGGGAATAMDYDAAQRAAKLKEFGDVQKARTGLIDIDRANVKEGIGAGQKAYEQGSLSQRQGLQSGTTAYNTDVGSRDSLYGVDVKSRDEALDREVEKLKARVNADATAALREGQSQERARTVYGATLSRVQELERRIDDDFAKQNGMLLMAEQSGKLDPAQKNQLETAKLLHQQAKAKIRRDMEPVLEDARRKLGVTSTDGFGDLKKAESKK